MGCKKRDRNTWRTCNVSGISVMYLFQRYNILNNLACKYLINAYTLGLGIDMACSVNV